MVSHFSYFKRLLYQPFLSIQSPPVRGCGLKFTDMLGTVNEDPVTSRTGGVD